MHVSTGKVNKNSYWKSQRVHMLKFNNLFNFGLESFTKTKRPAKLVKPATVYLCLASVFQSHLIFNRIERPLNLLMKKNCKAPKQQPFFSGNTSLLCQAWNHLGEHVPLNCFYPLSPVCNPTFAVSWLLYSSICMLPWPKNLPGTDWVLKVIMAVLQS